MSSRSELIEAATAAADEIGLANFICEHYTPGAPLPGDIINYAARFDPDAMAECRANLKELRSLYTTFRNGDHASDLVDLWAGTGADAFADRWAFLENHIANENDTDSLYTFFNTMLDDMEKIEIAATNLQKSCVHGIEGLADLRAAYCEALATSEEGSGTATITTIAGYMGTGAGIGGAGGVHGIVAGTVVGLLVGMAITFTENVMADSAPTLTTAPNLTTQLNDMELRLTGALSPEEYGMDGDGRTGYRPQETVGGGWEPE